MKLRQSPWIILGLVLGAHIALMTWLMGITGTGAPDMKFPLHREPSVVSLSILRNPPPALEPPAQPPPQPPSAPLLQKKPRKAAAAAAVPALPGPDDNAVLQSAGGAPTEGDAYSGRPAEEAAGAAAAGSEPADKDPGARPQAGLPLPGGQKMPESAGAATGGPDATGAPGAAVPVLRLAPFPGQITLSYDVHSPKDYQDSSGPSNTATAHVQSEKTATGEDSYRIRIEIHLNLLYRLAVGGGVTLHSRGLIGTSGLQPGRYSETTGKRPERWLEVDASGQEMRSYQIPALKVLPGTQDRLSAIWMLGMVARVDPAQLDKGRRFSVPMFSFRKVYTAHFESFGKEVLSSPAGQLDTLHVRYVTDEADSDKVDIWLGSDHEMQPVRIRWQEAEGRVIDLILSKKP